MCVVRVWHSLHKLSALMQMILGLKRLRLLLPERGTYSTAGPPRWKFNFDLLNWNTSGGRITYMYNKSPWCMDCQWRVWIILQRAPKLIQHELSLSSADTINNLSHLRRGSIFDISFEVLLLLTHSLGTDLICFWIANFAIELILKAGICKAGKEDMLNRRFQGTEADIFVLQEMRNENVILRHSLRGINLVCKSSDRWKF